MKILIVGSGGREHALAWKLARERGVEAVVCAPGNPGMVSVARLAPVDIGRPREVLALAETEGADLTVVGPEVPLSLGLADAFEDRGVPIASPSRAAAELESSKAFAKDFMTRHGIPTAVYRTCESADAALAVVEAGDLGFPLVVKADGLAAGKGVVVAEGRPEAEEAIRTMMLERRFGVAGARIVLEEYLVGQEASYFVLADGTAFVSLSSAQDHKRIFDGDRGPNTGGMGAFAPSPLMTSEMEHRVVDEIVRPALEGMNAEGRPFRGFLYTGLMLTESGPRVVEFNVRFGDPEAQVLLPMLEEDLSWLLGAAATGTLPTRPARFSDEPHVGIVLASGGYPESSEKGVPINGLDAAATVPGALVFHSGTARHQGQAVTAGGRVLTVVGRGPSYAHAIAVAYDAASRIHFDNMQFRSDIGRKAIA
jgi:phosphoribosylamine--glycine ligase